jgi:hypothetical protein
MVTMDLHLPPRKLAWFLINPGYDNFGKLTRFNKQATWLTFMFLIGWAKIGETIVILIAHFCLG